MDQEEIQKLVPRSYQVIGHIIHLTLRESQIPYKTEIAEYLLKNNSRIKTIINKAEIIQNTNRTFEFEFIAGEPLFECMVKENGFRYSLDYSKVYWNSKLSTEHKRIENMINPDELTIDLFCGVGPFVVPLLKKGCSLVCNDINPESVKWLKKNITLNKIKLKKGQFELTNKDTFDLIKEGGFFDRVINNEYYNKVHVLGNSPSMGLEVISTVLNCKIESTKLKKLRFHIYFFYKNYGGTNVKEELEHKYNDEGNYRMMVYNLQNIRAVASYKYMYRIDFGMESK